MKGLTDMGREIDRVTSTDCHACGKAGCAGECLDPTPLEEAMLDAAEQPMCFAACGTPVDNPLDFCSERCDRRANAAADQAATDLNG